MKRFLKPGWILVYILLLALFLKGIFGGVYDIDKTIHLAEGETISALYEEFGIGEKLQLKRYMGQHNDEVATVQPGSYIFSGNYTASELLQVFLDGPQTVYEHITLLEGRSIYDIDAQLSKEGLIEEGTYLDLVQDEAIIARYRERYPFIQQVFDERGSLLSLEGYLYPDTYFVDLDKNIVDQLIYLQLEGFNTKIWQPYGEQLIGLTSHVRSLGYEFSLSTYGALIIASIIEKEERVDTNRPIIASVFYNRLDTGMQIDADISLCYGLETGYESCTPSIIVEHLYDASNPYNTRAVAGLPPTPIASPTASSVDAVLTAKPSSNFFYLHASDGILHVASDIAGHQRNKTNYLP